MQKKMFEFKTKTIVATGLGAALFTLLFMYVKVPTGILRRRSRPRTVSARSSAHCLDRLRGDSSLLLAMHCLILYSTVPHGGAG